MNTVRAKFECYYIQEEEEVALVNLSAVTEGSPENEEFSKYTPAGTLSLVVDKSKTAAKFFEQGKEYYLDITVAE